MLQSFPTGVRYFLNYLSVCCVIVHVGRTWREDVNTEKVLIPATTISMGKVPARETATLSLTKMSFNRSHKTCLDWTGQFLFRPFAKPASEPHIPVVPHAWPRVSLVRLENLQTGSWVLDQRPKRSDDGHRHHLQADHYTLTLTLSV